MSLKVLAIAATLALSTASAFAEDMQMDMSKPMGDHSAVSHAFAEANAKMHKDMTLEYTGDTDVDFVRGMIPHHQGAIDMAKIELQYGKDPEIRKLAEAVIKAQEAEIADMLAWLKAHGK
ncbi:CopM family metallochaperone [Rhizobium sp. LjRoot258]|uniref:CopM family metallochaperone n=1 Tax=Rhizobium sp. LjRoot258 TaxID=3342299 RepID=UPI003ECD0ADB